LFHSSLSSLEVTYVPTPHLIHPLIPSFSTSYPFNLHSAPPLNKKFARFIPLCAKDNNKRSSSTHLHRTPPLKPDLSPPFSDCIKKPTATSSSKLSHCFSCSSARASSSSSHINYSPDFHHECYISLYKKDSKEENLISKPTIRLNLEINRLVHYKASRVNNTGRRNHSYSIRKRHSKHFKITEKAFTNMDFNPIEKATRNEGCATYKANKFMISKFQEALRDLKS